ncbi:MAG: glycosyltransferase [Candidatus Paceibacterota bacterium]
MPVKNYYFSVIIPTLNEEKLLPKLLGDLMKQSEQNFEVIIVDGGSEDTTRQKAEAFNKTLSLRFYTNKKKNVSYQRNFGAKKSLGTYLVFLDADVRLSEGFLKKLKREADKSKHLLLMPAIKTDDKSFKPLFNITNVLVKASQSTNRPFSFSGSMTFQSDFFTHLGGFDEKLYLAEDHDIVQRAKRAGVSGKVMLDNPLAPSLRRFKREGRFDVLKKYIIASVHTMKSGGGIDKKIFDYQMGGKQQVSEMANEQDSLEYIKSLFDTVKKQLDKVV